MAKPRKILTDYELQFLARTAAARLKDPDRTQARMARFLHIPQDKYKWYEIRSLLPHQHIDAFLTATSITYEWLFTGDGKGPAWQDRFEELRIRRDAEAGRQKAQKTKKVA